MKLYYEEFGSGPALVLVHGLFGSGTNLRGVARLLSDRYRVITVDLPNHGRSEHSGSMTYADMSASLRETLGRVDRPPLRWVGHSMGGKAVMDLALTHPELVERMVIVDIAPIRYAHDQWTLINAMNRLDPASLRSRAEADRLLSVDIEDTPTRLFLLQNLVPSEEGYRWRLNLPVLAKHHDDIMGFPDHGDAIHEGPVLVLDGARSHYVTTAHHAVFRRYFPAAEFETIADAGHWVHADQPRRVRDAIDAFMSDRSQTVSKTAG